MNSGGVSGKATPKKRSLQIAIWRLNRSESDKGAEDQGRAFKAEGTASLQLQSERQFGSFQDFPERKKSYIFLIDQEAVIELNEQLGKVLAQKIEP